MRKAASWGEERRFSKMREKAREISEADTGGWGIGMARRLSRSAIDTVVDGAETGVEDAMLNHYPGN